MPDYPWLLTRQVDYDGLPGRLRALRAVGLPYTDDQIANAPALARAEAEAIAAEVAAQCGPDRLADKEITALVAYLQRLGTMTEPPPAEDDREAHEAAEVEQTIEGTQPGPFTTPEGQRP